MIKDLLTSSKTHAQFVRYFVVAGLGLVFDFGTVIATKELLGINYIAAVTSGFLVGLTITYMLSNKLVFGAPKGDRRKAFLLFALIGVVGLGILNLCMWLLTGKLGINYIIAKGLATILVFTWNFFARKSLYDSQEISLS